ncbi:MAG: hypothetical protein Q8891_02215 [Bacteroidota bacterium]|nr:hypothetical protein [Bacteroidota bacterium]
MSFKLPKFLSEIIDNFTIEKVLAWLKEMVKFYLLPKSFFKTFYQNSFKEQLNQIIFYTIFQVIVVWLLFTEFSGQDAFRIVLVVAITSIPFSIANLLSFYLVSKSKFNTWKIISCIYLIWLLLTTPSVFFLSIYLSSENYLFYTISNVVNATAFFYSLFLIWHVFFDRGLKIILGYVLNIIILNFSFLLFSILFFDSYSKIKTSDPIVEELTENSSELKGLPGIPTTFIEETNLTSHMSTKMITLISNDSILYQNLNNIEVYKEMVKDNKQYLDSVIPLSHFRRNKVILKEFLKYNNNLENFFSNPACDTCLIKHIVYYNPNDSSNVIDEKEYVIDKSYTQPLKDFQKKIKDLSELYNIANYPGTITSFLLEPSILLAKIIGLKSDVRITFGF